MQCQACHAESVIAPCPLPQVRSVLQQLESVRGQYKRDVGAKEAECVELRRRLEDCVREVDAVQARAEKLQQELSREVQAGDRLRRGQSRHGRLLGCWDPCQRMRW